MRWLHAITVTVALMLPAGVVWAQAADGVLSDKEVETLRDSAYVPADRVVAYEKILNDRERMIDDLMTQRRHLTFGQDMHDLLEQFGSIADELNDNLDEYNQKHRDLRKVLPKLVEATEKWATALRAPADDEAYKIVKKIALDAVKDTHDIASEMLTSQEQYFKEHPEAAKAEKERKDNPHAPQ